MCVVEFELVGSQLFDDELIKGFVIIESVDDIISIGICVWITRVATSGLVARGLSESSQVEPVPSPSFTVVFTLQQAID